MRQPRTRPIARAFASQATICGMQKKNVISIAILAFFAGCAGGPVLESIIVRPLSAQHAAAGVQRWEGQCVAISGRGPESYAASGTEVMQRMGAEGWDLVTSTGAILCFQRPL